MIKYYVEAERERERHEILSSVITGFPHHGSTSLGLIKSQGCGSTYGEPKKDYLAMMPKRHLVPEHPFVSYVDGLDPSLAECDLTTLPIYTTGASPVGFLAFRISLTEGVFVLNPENATEPWYQFLPPLPPSSPPSL